MSYNRHNLYPMSDDDAEMLYETIGITIEELDQMREDAKHPCLKCGRECILYCEYCIKT